MMDQYRRQISRGQRHGYNGINIKSEKLNNFINAMYSHSTNADFVPLYVLIVTKEHHVLKGN